MAPVRIPPFEEFYAANRDACLPAARPPPRAEQAEDAFQETFLRALRAYAGLRHAEQLGAWVTTIAERVAIDVHRRSTRRPRSCARRTTWDGRPAHAELEHLAGALAGDGASRGRAPLRLRPRLRPDRRGARLERDRRAAGGLGRRAPPAKGARHDSSCARSIGASGSRPPPPGCSTPPTTSPTRPIGELLVATTDRGVCCDRVRAGGDARRARARSVGSRGCCASHDGSTAVGASSTSTSRASGRPSTSTWTSRSCRRFSSTCSTSSPRPVRRRDDVRSARGTHRQAASRPRRRRRAQQEPRADHPSLPPRDRCIGQPRRLRRRPRAQADAAAARGRALV